MRHPRARESENGQSINAFPEGVLSESGEGTKRGEEEE